MEITACVKDDAALPSVYSRMNLEMTRLRSPFQGVAVLLAVVLSHTSSASAQRPIFSQLQDNQLAPATELNPQNQATQAVENVFPQPIVDNHTNSGLDYYELPPAKDSSAEGMKHDGMMESKSDDKKDEEETEEEGGDISDLSKRLEELEDCLLYTSPSPRDQRGSRMPSSA